MPKILVTGGLGFIGSHLVEALLTNPENEVSVIDNMCSDSSGPYYKKGVRYSVDDVRNINKPETSAGVDIVFHLAALARIQPSFDNPREYFSINATGTAEVLEYARRSNAKVIYAGSSSAYGGPKLNPYSFAKYTGEQLCEMYSSVYGLSTVIARFFNVYGKRQPTTGPYATVVGVFEKQTARNEFLTITGDGNQRRDFTHVSDIVRGFISLSQTEWNGEIFNLGTGINYSINELAAMFGGTKKYIPRRPGEAQNTLADISKTAKETGWIPEINLKDYVREAKQ